MSNTIDSSFCVEALEEALTSGSLTFTLGAILVARFCALAMVWRYIAGTPRSSA
jgi:hypothetical protein